MIVFQMERTTLILISIVVIAIIVLGILGIVYYFKNKSVTSAATPKQQPPVKEEKLKIKDDNKPKSVVTFEEIQNEDEPFELDDPDESDQREDPEPEIREVDHSVHEEFISEETLPEPEEFEPHTIENSYYDNPYFKEPEKSYGSYASVGVNYGLPDPEENRDNNLNFQFSKKHIDNEDEHSE